MKKKQETYIWIVTINPNDKNRPYLAEKYKKNDEGKYNKTMESIQTKELAGMVNMLESLKAQMVKIDASTPEERKANPEGFFEIWTEETN